MDYGYGWNLTMFIHVAGINTHSLQMCMIVFQVKEVIAKGAFGNVLKVVRWSDNRAFAMKVSKSI